MALSPSSAGAGVSAAQSADPSVALLKAEVEGLRAQIESLRARLTAPPLHSYPHVKARRAVKGAGHAADTASARTSLFYMTIPLSFPAYFSCSVSRNRSPHPNSSSSSSYCRSSNKRRRRRP